MENNKTTLMRAIQMYDFYLTELNLYLDTHPDCPKGLSAFARYSAMKDQAVKAYNLNYGPINACQSDCENVFEWAKGPWPWEKEAN